MKAVILAGGFGTRISEESGVRPKPLVDIGGRPILWHIMKIYSAHQINDFIICLGYKGYMIKEYFSNYFLHMSDVTFDIQNNCLEILNQKAEPWRVTLVDTGERTQTGGRLKRILPFLGDDDFCCTYGDGVGDIDISRLVAFHRDQGRLATLTAVRPPARFGALEVLDDRVARFDEKPLSGSSWINGGFFVLNPCVLRDIGGDDTIWEREPLERLAERGELSAFLHKGFWHPMDTLRDKQYLEDSWNRGDAPWKIWG